MATENIHLNDSGDLAKKPRLPNQPTAARVERHGY